MTVRNAQALLAVVLIAVGVAWFSIPAAMVVVGVLLLVDRLTT